MAEIARSGASLIVVAVPPAARSLAPPPKTGSPCRDCASSPLLLPRRAGHADPRASSRKARDYGDPPPGCQRALARFRRRRLGGTVAADFGPVVGIEAQKAEGREQRDQRHQQKHDPEILGRY